MSLKYIIDTEKYEKLDELWENELKEKYYTWLEEEPTFSTLFENIFDLIKDRNFALFLKNFKNDTLIEYATTIIDCVSVQERSSIEEKQLYWEELTTNVPDLIVMDKFREYYDESVDEVDWIVDENGQKEPPLIKEKLFYTLDELAEIYINNNFIHPYLEVQEDLTTEIKARALELKSGKSKDSTEYGNLAWSLFFEENNDFQEVNDYMV